VQDTRLLPPKIAESDTEFLGHGLCGSGGSIYNKDTIKIRISDYTKKIDPTT
jgi:hypothetical protein